MTAVERAELPEQIVMWGILRRHSKVPLSHDFLVQTCLWLLIFIFQTCGVHKAWVRRLSLRWEVWRAWGLASGGSVDWEGQHSLWDWRGKLAQREREESSRAHVVNSKFLSLLHDVRGECEIHLVLFYYKSALCTRLCFTVFGGNVSSRSLPSCSQPASTGNQLSDDQSTCAGLCFSGYIIVLLLVLYRVSWPRWDVHIRIDHNWAFLCSEQVFLWSMIGPFFTLRIWPQCYASSGLLWSWYVVHFMMLACAVSTIGCVGFLQYKVHPYGSGRGHVACDDGCRQLNCCNDTDGTIYVWCVCIMRQLV